MRSVSRYFRETGLMDQLASGDSSIHALDPRAKLIVTLFFIITVMSFDKYSILPLLPFFIFPVILMAAADIPPGAILRKLLLVLPFALVVGVFNPVLDRAVMLRTGPLEISGGWISFTSIVLRSVLTVGTALILLATTGINNICFALGRLGVPPVFVNQILFLYRYIFVVMDQGLRTARARECRSFGNRGTDMTTHARIVGGLLIRSLDRAQRIHTAMRCRGFTGTIHPLGRHVRFGRRDLAFTVLACLAFLLARLYNIPGLLGNILTKQL